MSGVRDPRRNRISRECSDCGAETWKPGAMKCFDCLASKQEYRPVAHPHNWRPRKRAGGRCDRCEGMSWRRPENKACECGEFYRPEERAC